METAQAYQARRSLKFETIQESLDEADRLVQAEERGRLRLSGTWTLGQIFGHMASWIEYAYVGYPFRVPWFVRLMLRGRARRLIRKGMKPGVRIPGAPGGTYGAEMISTVEGASRFKAEMKRLESGEAVRFESPAFGPMTQEEGVQLALRHAELHMSFAHYQ
jgi:hypothetical protein